MAELSSKTDSTLYLILNTFSTYIGNLRNDISVAELKNNLKSLFETVGIEVRLTNIDVHRQSWKKPSFAFMILPDKNTFDFAVEKLNGLSDNEILFPGKELVVSPAHRKTPHQLAANPVTKSMRKNATKFKHNLANNNRNRNIGAQTMKTTVFNDHRASSKEQHSSVLTDQNGQDFSAIPSTSFLNMQPGSSGVDSFDPFGKYFYVGQKLGTEDRLTEYKQGGGKYLAYKFKADVEKYVCAFLNSEGGTLFIGVKDDCTVCGIEIPNSKKEDQLRLDMDKIMKGFNPKVFPNLYSIKFTPVYSMPINHHANTSITTQEGLTVSSFNEIENSQQNTESLMAKPELNSTNSEANSDGNILSVHPSFHVSSPCVPRKLPPLNSASNSSSNHSNIPSLLSNNFSTLKSSDQSNAAHTLLNTKETTLKVIEVSVNLPPRQKGGQHTLYQNLNREVYIRRDGSIQGPLQANEIVEWGRCNMAESLHMEHNYLKKEVYRKQEEITMNLKLVDELVKQKQFLENQHKEKEDTLTSEIDRLRTREREMEDELEQVRKAKSKVCTIF